MEKIFGFVPITIQDGQTEAFIEGARECHKAALPDLTGTGAYEWFLAENGKDAYVIEIYDDPAAVAHHSKMMDGRVGKLKEIAEFKITFAGDVPEDMRAIMQKRLGAVEYVGPRAFGRLTDPAPHHTPPAGDERIYALAWFRPKPGQHETFRELARQSYDRAYHMDRNNEAVAK